MNAVFGRDPSRTLRIPARERACGHTLALILSHLSAILAAARGIDLIWDSPMTLTLARTIRFAGVLAVALTVCGFTADRRLDESSIVKPFPKDFRIHVVEGDLRPETVRYRREGRVYINEDYAPGSGAVTNVLQAPWFSVHKTVDDAIILEYPATDHLGRPVIKLDYALEVAHNHLQLYRLDTNRLLSTMEEMESAGRRGVASRREIERYNELVSIWNAREAGQGPVPSEAFHIDTMDDINFLIRISRRLDDGHKLFVTTGDVVEVYVR